MGAITYSADLQLGIPDAVRDSSQAYLVVMLDARTRLEPHGAGLAHSILSDERGPLGLAAQSLFVAERS